MHTDPEYVNAVLQKQIAALQRELRRSREETTYLMAVLRRIVKHLKLALTR